MDTKMLRNMVLVAGLGMIAGVVGVCQGGDTGNNQQKVLSAGVVLRVNNDALTSRQVIFPLREQLAKLVKKAVNKEAFAIMAQPVIEKAVMARLYNLLLYQQAKKKMDKMEIPEQAVDKVLDDEKQAIITRYGGSIAKVQDALAAKGSSLEEVLQNKKQQIIIESYQELIFVPALNITRGQMMRYYRQHKQDEFSQKAVIQFQLIDIKKDMCNTAEQARQKVQEAYKQVQNGKDFAEVARALSQGYRSKQGGMWDAMDPAAVRKDYQPVVSVLKKIKVNQVTGIIETDKHFFIARLIKMQPARTEPFARAQFDIRRILRQQQWKKFSAILSQQLLKKAAVGDIGNFITETINFTWLNLTVNSEQ